MKNETIVNVLEVLHKNHYEITINGVTEVVSMCEDIITYVMSKGVVFNCYDKINSSYKMVDGKVCYSYNIHFYYV